jgi:hypothetical protein
MDMGVNSNMKTKNTILILITALMLIVTLHQASATPQFQDNFDRPNNETVGGLWSEITGSDWKILNSNLYFNASIGGNHEIITTSNTTTGNYDGFKINATVNTASPYIYNLQIYIKPTVNKILTLRWQNQGSSTIDYYNGVSIITCASNFSINSNDWIFLNKTGSNQVIVYRQGNFTNLCNITTTYNGSFITVGNIELSTLFGGLSTPYSISSVCSANTMAECYTTPACAINADCGTCQYCNAGTCNNQTSIQDLKNECNSTTSCTNAYTYGITNGLCNGLGNCTTTPINYNVTSGNVCINSTLNDTNPTAGTNCAIWYDCVTNYTTANQYLTGYIGNGSPTCTATDWQYTGGNYTTPSGYAINTTNQGLNCTIDLIPECAIDADCGLCQYCNATKCQNQTSIQDLKNECTANYNCVNPYIYSDGTDFCNGLGSCASTRDYNVTQGNVCINSTSYDVDPQSAGKCAIWYDCISNMTTANEYYTGYQGDNTPTCTNFDWKPTGGSLIAPNGSYINTTAQGLNCSIFTPLFTYEQNDLLSTLIDALGGFIVGFSKVALIIGLVAGLVLFVYLFTIGTEKLAPINKRK